MADAEELETMREEEVMALEAVYPEELTIESPNHFTIRVADFEDEAKSVLLDLVWSDSYPNELPEIKVLKFDLAEEATEAMAQQLRDEAEGLKGEAMSFILVEFLREKLGELFNFVAKAKPIEPPAPAPVPVNVAKSKQPKGPKMSKQEKRKHWDRVTAASGGEKPRGYDWVCLISHLKKTADSK